MNRNLSPWAAFKLIYSFIEFVWDPGCVPCKGGGGYTPGPHKIIFASLSQPGGNRTPAMAMLNARNNVVHELGHAFAQRWYSQDGGYDPEGPYVNVPKDLWNNEGFHPSPESASLTWQQHPCEAADSVCRNEVFADMFLGWTYDTWDNDILGMGSYRDAFMTTNMSEWITALGTR